MKIQLKKKSLQFSYQNTQKKIAFQSTTGKLLEKFLILIFCEKSHSQSIDSIVIRLHRTGPSENMGTWPTIPRLSEISDLGKVIFDIPFMIQSHAESMKKIVGAL